jgi:hypothetical protein
LVGSGPSGAPPGSSAWPVDPVPASAPLRRSCATARAIPSWISGSGPFGVPSASKARGRVPAKNGESDRLIEGAATCSPIRSTSPPRPSAWSNPLRALWASCSISVPTAPGSITTGYAPGGSSTGRPAAPALAAARSVSPVGSSDLAATAMSDA